MWSIMCIFSPALLEQIFSIIRENRSFIRDCSPQQVFAVKTLKKLILFSMHLSRSKTIPSSQSLLSTGF